MLYFMLLAAEVFGGRDIDVGEYFLTDLPINLFIASLVYLVIFWCVVLTFLYCYCLTLERY